MMFLYLALLPGLVLGDYKIWQLCSAVSGPYFFSSDALPAQIAPATWASLVSDYTVTMWVWQERLDSSKALLYLQNSPDSSVYVSKEPTLAIQANVMNGNATPQVINVPGQSLKTWELVAFVVSHTGNYTKICSGAPGGTFTCKQAAVTVTPPVISTDTTTVILGAPSSAVFDAKIHMIELLESEIQLLVWRGRKVDFKFFSDTGRYVNFQDFACQTSVKKTVSSTVAAGAFYYDSLTYVDHYYIVFFDLQVLSGDADLLVHSSRGYSWSLREIGSDSLMLNWSTFTNYVGDVYTVTVLGYSTTPAVFTLTTEVIVVTVGNRVPALNTS